MCIIFVYTNNNSPYVSMEHPALPERSSANTILIRARSLLEHNPRKKIIGQFIAAYGCILNLKKCAVCRYNIKNSKHHFGHSGL